MGMQRPQPSANKATQALCASRERSMSVESPLEALTTFGAMPAARISRSSSIAFSHSRPWRESKERESVARAAREQRGEKVGTVRRDCEEAGKAAIWPTC